MLAYCTKADALAWVTPGSVTPNGRQIAAVRPDADSFELEDHRLETGYEVQLWLRSNGEMADPLVEGAVYYAIRVSERTFQLAVSLADAITGTAIDITTEGSNMRIVPEIPWDTIIDRNSVYLGEKMIANAFPLGDGAPVPPEVKRLCSLLSLGDAATFIGAKDVDIEAHLERAYKELDELWAKGKPLRDTPPPATNTAASGTPLSGSAADGRGWLRRCGGVEVIP